MSDQQATQARIPTHFVGVRTTKIYCYPWCTAPQPKAENVTHYATREEAERAGLRPCRACFPHLPEGSWQDHKTHVSLLVREPFRFEEILHYLARSSEEVLHTIEGRTVHKLVVLQGLPVPIRVESPAPNRVEVYFEYASDRLPKKSLRVEAARFVWDWLDLGREVGPFYELAEKDAMLRGLVRQYEGLRIVGEPVLFEALCWAIIGQQVSLVLAYRMKRRFVETFGTSLTYNGRTYWKFPEADVIADLTPEQILPLKFTRKKAEYLIDVAKRVCSGELSKRKLLALNDLQAVSKQLTAIRGIGDWTANYVAMRCLRYGNAFPLGDVALQNAVKRLKSMERKPTQEELRELAIGWKGWEAYATFYLWRSLQE
ncbi:MAG TPA: Ada metal-binding domain-containing protein [Bacilli bacterium]|nr:Ada metal-binding domain-containing protein [Bacilli bacterium]